MTVQIKRHLIMTVEEQYAIVNALAFYHDFHEKKLDEDALKQFKLAYKEDSYGSPFVDQLATKVANIF